MCIIYQTMYLIYNAHNSIECTCFILKSVYLMNHFPSEQQEDIKTIIKKLIPTIIKELTPVILEKSKEIIGEKLFTKTSKAKYLNKSNALEEF